MPNLIPNFIKKIEFESNFKVIELEPCDIATRYNMNHRHFTSSKNLEQDNKQIKTSFQCEYDVVVVMGKYCNCLVVSFNYY